MKRHRIGVGPKYRVGRKRTVSVHVKTESGGGLRKVTGSFIMGSDDRPMVFRADDGTYIGLSHVHEASGMFHSRDPLPVEYVPRDPRYGFGAP